MDMDMIATMRNSRCPACGTRNVSLDYVKHRTLFGSGRHRFRGVLRCPRCGFYSANFRFNQISEVLEIPVTEEWACPTKQGACHSCNEIPGRYEKLLEELKELREHDWHQGSNRAALAMLLVRVDDLLDKGGSGGD